MRNKKQEGGDGKSNGGSTKCQRTNDTKRVREWGESKKYIKNREERKA